MSNVKAVAAGYDHTVVLTTDGKVYTWGNNSNGQLGDGSTTGRTTPAQVGGADISNIKAIDAGYKYTIALGSDGTVWTWGYNNKGQLGNNTQTDSYTPQQVGTLSGSVIASIAAGYDHALSARNDGTVWAWGNNSSGQLGDNSTTARTNPQQVSTLSGAVAVSAGQNDTLALLKADEAFRSWG
ncbi:MAG: RCC1 repeat-containing protein, partial [Deltaproteobacteria bacterium]|nr:RCC1 repeat-containing protein [Deltaproteobacteria bacterium]